MNLNDMPDSEAADVARQLIPKLMQIAMLAKPFTGPNATCTGLGCHHCALTAAMEEVEGRWEAPS